MDTLSRIQLVVRLDLTFHIEFADREMCPDPGVLQESILTQFPELLWLNVNFLHVLSTGYLSPKDTLSTLQTGTSKLLS